ncbi:hypothetical protein FA95DRAFT_481768 [Auriscalpium vulgare]|uniref:Uncharacterized protein n=1 Tax=Auriscalpium vulgare TaxID=40419 RepID=A0ACB8SBB8_9AGAM|nr:hypothetical protein FA95DRAFT_481768 [Auriscalpium vulgare]
MDAFTTGPILTEGLLQALCQGVVFAQAVKYWESPLDDTRRMKAYVTLLVFLSLLQTSVTVYKLTLVLVLKREWSTSPLNWADLFLNGLICSTCEVFLIRRCWKLTGKMLWVLVVLAFVWITAFVANVHLAAEIGSGAKSEIANNDPLKTNRFFPTVFSFNYWIVSSVVLDVTITTILTVWLWKSKTGYNYLDKALKHIIGITWESAAIPFVSMVIAVTLYQSQFSRGGHLVMLFILMTGKFYILGIFRTLNSRGKLRERMHSNPFARQSLSDVNWDQEPVTNSIDRRGSDETVVAPDSIPPDMVLGVSRSLGDLEAGSASRLSCPPTKVGQA